MKKFRTPQKKKLLSYIPGRRNLYGESRTSAIKSIRRRKAAVNRSDQRAVAQRAKALSLYEPNEKFASLVYTVVREKWKKYPDRPLVEYIESRSQKRRFANKLLLEPPSSLMKEAKRRLRK